jgi:hypothetical protein
VVVHQVAKRAAGRWLADAGVEVAAADKCLGTRPSRVRVRGRRRVRGTEGGKRLESKSAANELAELFERLRCKGRGEWERVGVKVAADNEGLSASLTTAPGLAHPYTAAAAKRVEPGRRRRGGSGGRNIARLDSLHLHIVELCPLVVGAAFASLRAGEEGAELRTEH